MSYLCPSGRFWTFKRPMKRSRSIRIIRICTLIYVASSRMSWSWTRLLKTWEGTRSSSGLRSARGNKAMMSSNGLRRRTSLPWMILPMRPVRLMLESIWMLSRKRSRKRVRNIKVFRLGLTIKSGFKSKFRFRNTGLQFLSSFVQKFYWLQKFAGRRRNLGSRKSALFDFSEKLFIDQAKNIRGLIFWS